MLSLNTLLHPTDFSTPANAALKYALDLAVRSNAALHVLHITGTPPNEALRTRLTETMEQAKAQLVSTAQPLVHTEVIHDAHVVQKMVEHAAQAQVDLIVLGTHGHRGLKHFLLGSVAEAIVRKAPCPVLVVRALANEPSVTIARILVPVDFSPASKQTLAWAKALAARYEAAVDVLFVAEEHVVPFFSDTGLPTLSIKRVDDEIIEQAGEALRQLNAEVRGPDVPVEVHVRRGAPLDEIVAFAEEHETGLIAMATHGFTGLEHGLLGSVTERVIRLAPCPVWTANPGALDMEQDAGADMR